MFHNRWPTVIIAQIVEAKNYQGAKIRICGPRVIYLDYKSSTIAREHISHRVDVQTVDVRGHKSGLAQSRTRWIDDSGDENLGSQMSADRFPGNRTLTEVLVPLSGIRCSPQASGYFARLAL